MKRLLMILAATLMTASGHAQVSDRVVELPETGGNWYVTAVYSSIENPTARDRQLQDLLRNDVALSRLVQQVTFTEWDDSDQFIQQSAWASYLGTNRPALLLQTPATEHGTGNVVYFASGPHLKTDHNLAPSVAAAVRRFRETNGNPCPRCPVDPVVTPTKPTRPTIPITIPIDVKPQQPAKEETPLLMVLGLPLLGAGLALFQSVKQESSI